MPTTGRWCECLRTEWQRPEGGAMTSEEARQAIRTGAPVIYRGRAYARLLACYVTMSNSGTELVSVAIYDARDGSVMRAVARFVELA